MKGYCLVVVFLFSKAILLAQAPITTYARLVKKADDLYHLKNYKVAASTYVEAFKLKKNSPSISDRFNAACVFTLAEMKDSAFAQLFYITQKNNYSRYDQLTTEHDLQTLQKEKRWKQLILLVKENEAQKEAKLNKPLIQELHEIYLDDQHQRLAIEETQEKFGDNSNELKVLRKVINEKDSVNLLKVKTILDASGWLGPDALGEEGNSTLFLVIQRADQKTQEHYLPVMREAVKKGDASSGDLAFLEDGVALAQGKKQIYGSQIIKNPKTGKDTLAPIEDAINVNKRRAAVGLAPLNFEMDGKTTSSTSYKNVNKDFRTALLIKDSVVGPCVVSAGFGTSLEVRGESGFYEHNSSWFKIIMPFDTLLTFDIVPELSKDDFDFIIFKCNASDCLSKIQTHEVSPDRACFSINFDKNGSTGLSEYAYGKHLGGGPGAGYVSALPVKAGEVLYLMVNSWDAKLPGSFTIYFYNYWPQKPIESLKKRFSQMPKPIVLENVLFETNRSTLLKESFVSLDKLVDQLQKNKQLKIEIDGHTDNVGDEIQNQKLSEERAKKIVDYLVSKKIEQKRLTSKGFGSQHPIASNETDEGRKKNRRVAFIVIK